MSSVGDSTGNLPWRMNSTLPSVRVNFARVPVRRNVPLWTRISPSIRMSRGEPLMRRFDPDISMLAMLFATENWRTSTGRSIDASPRFHSSQNGLVEPTDAVGRSTAPMSKLRI